MVPAKAGFLVQTKEHLEEIVPTPVSSRFSRLNHLKQQIQLTHPHNATEDQISKNHYIIVSQSYQIDIG